MMNFMGAFVLVLIIIGPTGHPVVAMHEFDSYAACSAAVIQLQPIRYATGYCIAKDIVE